MLASMLSARQIFRCVSRSAIDELDPSSAVVVIVKLLLPLLLPGAGEL